MRYPMLVRLAAVALITAVCSFVCAAAELDLSAKAALLMEAHSGRILYAENIDEPLPVASISKLMTLILVLEAVDTGMIALNDLVTASEYAASMGGSQVWLEKGEQLTLEELLYAVAVGSGNDASVAVAEYLAGSESAFVALMNQKAAELGLTNTEYSNASGLPPSLLGSSGRQVMSARDVAVLCRYALNVPRLLDFVSTYEYTMRADTTRKPVLWNYNKLLRRYQGVDGFKTGYTTEAGHCIAATAVRGGLRLIAVVLGSTSESARESDVTKLLDLGFREYTYHLIHPQGTVVGEIVVPKGDPETVKLIVGQDFYAPVKRGEQDQIKISIEVDERLQVPISQETTIGAISAYLGELLLGKADIKPEQSVARSSVFKLMTRITRQMIRSLTEGSL
ncbi:MAG: D-alanyl-D-alanine carboxypeptidase family protein [Limnochordia bacterium]